VALKVPQPQDIVIVGATGDLTRRKLAPALFNLFLRGLLPEGRIIGYARTEWSDADFEQAARKAVQEFGPAEFDERVWQRFAERLKYVPAREGLSVVARRVSERSRLVYLAVPPSAFQLYARSLAQHDLVTGTKLVIEKPFGRDYASALELNAVLHEHFSEEQIFRIDHYLGKETVQNILVLRFGNSIFERIWNRDAIDHVQITIAEDLGIEGRGAFYEETGALRDIVQNHALQLLSLLTMEPPVAFRPEAIRDEKAKLFQALKPAQPHDAVLGQYAGATLDGAYVPGYLEEARVSPTSTTETFVALKLHIENWRWAGVPFFIRTGKRLAGRDTEISIAFRDVPKRFFEEMECGDLPPNLLRIEIQPEEAVKLSVMAKIPGPELDVKPVTMEFSYGNSFMSKPDEAYERLIHDALEGDHTLFARADGVERCWQVLQPLIEKMPPVHPYAAGSWGPPEADRLIAPKEWYEH
jgi:glucose-6-phosphate 1-dehydrogenase